MDPYLYSATLSSSEQRQHHPWPGIRPEVRPRRNSWSWTMCPQPRREAQVPWTISPSCQYRDVQGYIFFKILWSWGGRGLFTSFLFFSVTRFSFCRVLYCLFPLLSENNFQILKLKKYCVLGRFNPPIFLFLLSPTFLFHSYFPKPRPWYYASCIPLHLLNSCMYFYGPYINNFPPGQSWMLSRQWSQNSLPIDSDLDRNKKFYSVTVKTITGWNGNGISVGPMHVRLHPPQVSPKFTAGVFNT